MDHFGIGNAVEGAFRVAMQASRQTGRTTLLVESVKYGDRIIFSNSQEAARVKQRLNKRGINVDCIVIESKETHKLLGLGTSQGRTIFDHSWVEQTYLDAILSARYRVDTFEERLSGYGVAHRRTRKQAEELIKWQL